MCVTVRQSETEEARERQRDLFLLPLWSLPSVRVWKHILLLYLPNPATVRARTCTTYTVPGLRPSTRAVFVWLRRMVELISAWSWKEQQTWRDVRDDLGKLCQWESGRNHTVKVTGKTRSSGSSLALRQETGLWSIMSSGNSTGKEDQIWRKSV